MGREEPAMYVIFSELPIAKLIFTNMSVTSEMLNIFSANISRFTVFYTGLMVYVVQKPAEE